MPTASAKYNFYGADRKGSEPVRGLFAGARCAYWQTWPVALSDGASRHLGQYDDANRARKLLTIRHEGKMVDVVAEVSKGKDLWWVFLTG